VICLAIFLPVAVRRFAAAFSVFNSTKRDNLRP